MSGPAAWTADCADRLSAAKLWAITTGDLPYLATAVYALITVPTDRVASMSTDPRWRLYVNPAWLADTEVPVAAEALVHHVWHLIADHAGRAESMQVQPGTAAFWKTATDVSVEQVVPWRDPALSSWRDLHLPPDRSAEEYYAMLSGLPAVADTVEPDGSTRPDASCGSGCDGIPRPHDVASLDPDIPAVDPHLAESLRRGIAIEFREHCRRIGRTPGEWGRWIADILDPIVPWPQVLHAAVRRGLAWGAGHTDYTYRRISRRQAVAGAVVLPALRRPIPAVVLIIDTSGSVDDGLLAQALGEVDGVLASLAVPAGSVTTMAVDAAVQTVARVRDAAAVRLAGGGGTDMGVGIAAALRTRPAPQLIVVLTDGHTPWPATPPVVPVIAAVLGRDRAELPPTPPWLQRVEVVPGR